MSEKRLTGYAELMIVYAVRPTKLLPRARKICKERGIWYVVRAGIRGINNHLTMSFGYYYYKIFKSWRTFAFQGQAYRYFYHNYNKTWRNERAVEVPIVWQILRNMKEGRKEHSGSWQRSFALFSRAPRHHR